MQVDDKIEPQEAFGGKVVVVTGGGAGFGEGFCRAFAQAGASAVVLDIDATAASRVADSIVQQGGRAIAVRCDVADEESVEHAAAAAVAAFGGIDLLINNAGLHLTKYNQRFDQLTRAEIRSVLEVNVMGIVNCTLSCKGSMAARGGGAIVNISSISGYAGTSPYAVSKLAVRGLTVAFAQELSADKIRVNAIAPGLIATPSALADLPPEMFVNFAAQFQQVKRRGEIADVVAMALFLCSPAASFVTGETIKVSGGYPLTI